MLRISARRVDRVMKRFVEDGLEAALGRRIRGASGRAHLRRSARGARAVGRLADRMVELGYIDGVSHETAPRSVRMIPAHHS